MTQFYLKHPTKPDFWVSSKSFCLNYHFFNAFENIQSYLEGKPQLNDFEVTALNEKIDFFMSHPDKSEKYVYYKKKGDKTEYEMNFTAPMSFGANSSQFAEEFEDLRKDIIEPLQACFDIVDKVKDIENSVKKIKDPNWLQKENILLNLSKNPLEAVKVWKKTLESNSFITVPLDSQERLYSSKAYALFFDDESSGYYAHKSYGNTSLSEATLFDTELLAKRQAKKCGNEAQIAIVEVQIQFKKIVSRPEKPQDIDKLQAYHDKEEITQFFAQHNIDKLRAELERLEAQNKELKLQNGITEEIEIKPVAKTKHKI